MIPGSESAAHAYDNAEPDNTDVCMGCDDNDCGACDGECCDDCHRGELEDPYFDSED